MFIPSTVTAPPMTLRTDQEHARALAAFGDLLDRLQDASQVSSQTTQQEGEIEIPG